MKYRIFNQSKRIDIIKDFTTVESFINFRKELENTNPYPDEPIIFKPIDPELTKPKYIYANYSIVTKELTILKKDEEDSK